MTTPSQTVGPFFGYALPWTGDRDVVPPWTPGAVTVHGAVFDGAGAPVADALLETWQAGPDGTIPAAPGSLRRGGVGFTGFGRVGTDPDGRYVLHTLRPGAVDGQRPHIAVVVFARGLLRCLHTRIHFPEDIDVGDPLAAGLDPQRAATLVAQQEGTDRYRFDIHLQGAAETVFLDLEQPP